jgi:hypothetical protein
MHRPSPAIHRADRRAAAIDVGLALYESSMIRRPSAVSKTSIRPAVMVAVESPPAISSTERCRMCPTAAAARAFDTMCWPGTVSETGATPEGVTRSNDAVPVCRRTVTWPARTSASAAEPKKRTLAFVLSEKARTTRSSAFNTAVPSSGSDSGSSALASRSTSGEPNSCICARPTPVTTPI